MNIPLIPKLQKGKNILIVDVGSGSIGMALVEVRSGGPSIVHFSYREALAHSDRSKEQLISALIEKTQAVSEKLLQTKAEGVQSQMIKNLSQVFVVLHAPWARSYTNSTAKSFEEVREITSDMVEKLADRAAAESAREKSETLECSIVRVELNGYPTAKPRGKRARFMEATVIQSEAEMQLVKGVRAVVEKFLPGRNSTVRSATVVDAHVLRSYASQVPRFLVADVTSEATAFTVIEYGNIVSTHIVPIGVRTIIRRVAKQESVSEENIESQVRMFMQDMCNDDSCKGITKAFNEVAGGCTTEFGKAFDKMTKEHHLPNTLVLHVHPAFEQWFVNFFERVDFSQFTQTTQPFVVAPLTAAKLAQFSIFLPGVENDASIATAATFVHNQYTESVGSKGV